MDEESINHWKQHPVTKFFLQRVEEERQSLIELLARGMAFKSENIVAAYAKNVGIHEALLYVLQDAFLKKPEVQEESSEEAK